MALLVAHTTSTESPSFRDGNHTFLLHLLSSATSILCQARDRAVDEANTQLPKELLFYEDGKLPPEELMPKFSMRQYYSHLHGADVHADSGR